MMWRKKSKDDVICSREDTSPWQKITKGAVMGVGEVPANPPPSKSSQYPPPDELQWAGALDRRCRARLEPNPSGYWGRCDLKVHDVHTDHALERGFNIPRWSTRFTGF